MVGRYHGPLALFLAARDPATSWMDRHPLPLRHPKRGDSIDTAEEQHTLLIDLRIAQRVGCGLTGILRPDTIGLFRYIIATLVPLPQLTPDRALNLHPVVWVFRIDQEHGELGIGPDPVALVPVRSRVNKDLPVGVIKPHRRQAGATIR